METTLTLRKRLGFNEMSLWKQFCARRLHLIHTLSLNLRKASEQDEQVRVLAAELCAEYGFASSSQPDFEKLLIAGIQSVRRNQKRSSRNPPSGGATGGMVAQRAVSYPLSFAADAPRPPMYDPMKRAAEQNSHPDATESQKRGSDASINSDNGTSAGRPSHPGSERQQQLPPTPNSVHGDSQSGAIFDTNQAASLAASYEKPGTNALGKYAMLPQSAAPTSAPGSASGPSVGAHHETPMTQSLVVRLDVLRGMITAASATWIESSAPLLAQMSADSVLSTAVAAAAVHAKLDPNQCYEMRDSLMRGALLESLRLALDPRLTTTKLLERIGALAASLVHGPNLLSALQALFVSLAQAAHGSLEDMRYVLKPMALQDGYVVDPGVHQHPVYQYYRQPRLEHAPSSAGLADTSADATTVVASRDSVGSIASSSYSHRNPETGSVTAHPPANSSERNRSIPQLSTTSVPVKPATQQPSAGLSPLSATPLSATPLSATPLSAAPLGSHTNSLPHLPAAMSAPAPPASTSGTTNPATTAAAAPLASGSPTSADISAQNLRSLLSLAPMPAGGFPAAGQTPFGLPMTLNPNTGLPLYSVPPGFMSLPMHMMPYPLQHSHSAAMPPAVQPQPPPPAPSGPAAPTTSSAPAAAATTPSKPENQSTNAASPSARRNDEGVVHPGPDRLVTIQYNDRVLQMTYSPLKATPPTISEIIDNARQSFAIPASTVVRVRYVQGDKIIESNTELIEAFNDREVQLELLVPPPLLGLPPRPETGARFTPLAPIFRASS